MEMLSHTFHSQQLRHHLFRNHGKDMAIFSLKINGASLVQLFLEMKKEVHTTLYGEIITSQLQQLKILRHLLMQKGSLSLQLELITLIANLLNLVLLLLNYQMETISSFIILHEEVSQAKDQDMNFNIMLGMLF